MTSLDPVKLQYYGLNVEDRVVFNTGDKICVTSAAMRRVPETERCSPSEVALESPITFVKNRFGTSETPYFAANRRWIRPYAILLGNSGNSNMTLDRSVSRAFPNSSDGTPRRD
jgi:hypothetical protein